jgi:LAO/AO transport system kinase
MTNDEIRKKLAQGDRRALAKAITLVESTLPKSRREAEKLLTRLMPETGKSVRIGISGSPGVGKSSFIEILGQELVRQGRSLAVLAVDPSSPVTGGSIMGDKTRMEKLALMDKVFIRPSPSKGVGGGVARRTREAILLCEAAGFDTILVETVGVGQSEVSVAGMVDVFLVLQMPNSGDELQGIKKGLLELADLVAITKADGESLAAAKRAQLEHERALKLVRLPENHASVILTSAVENQGFGEVIKSIEEFIYRQRQNKGFVKKRQEQNKTWFYDEISVSLRERFFAHKKWKGLFLKKEKEVSKGKVPASIAADSLIAKLF